MKTKEEKAAYMKEWWARQTPERKKELTEKKNEYRRQQRARWSKEDKKVFLQNNRVYQNKYYSNLTQDQKDLRNEKARARYANTKVIIEKPNNYYKKHTCLMCQVEFYGAPRAKRCSPCQHEYDRFKVSERSKTPPYKNSARASTTRSKKFGLINWKKRILARIKTAIGCTCCGYNKNPVALVFHHTEEKKCPIQSNRSWETILAEVDKCTVLCHRCHIIYHTESGFPNRPKKMGRPSCPSERWKHRIVARVKMLNGCAHCGYNEHPSALALHHIYGKDKLLSYSRCWKFILAELDKCVILCHNCHNILHHADDHCINQFSSRVE